MNKDDLLSHDVLARAIENISSSTTNQPTTIMSLKNYTPAARRHIKSIGPNTFERMVNFTTEMLTWRKVIGSPRDEDPGAVYSNLQDRFSDMRHIANGKEETTPWGIPTDFVVGADLSEYSAGDGMNDIQKMEAVRDLIIEQLDWDVLPEPGYYWNGIVRRLDLMIRRERERRREPV